MDKHKKTYASKWQNHYTDEYKGTVCNEFLNGFDSKTSIERKYGFECGWKI